MGDDPKYPSQLAERFQIRLPDGLRDRIRDAAERNHRSMNAEILCVLLDAYPEPEEAAERLVIDALEELVELKGMKDAFGGGKEYEDRKATAWERARAALAQAREGAR
ncbi:Arc family DNA-binding protein [Acuticoccus sp. M5D2P5]|uniref:Arc family DNA-binding protein n=1 Tax=Acuticoccus kalidii TaxID=2910977 RepID=UPI001F45DC2A|nr:Arc family DNA-binding protein [Acuticoccus kalidii]MCF3932886.1 Arc family DNA-binding protein [Acuticoccus kalidii]